MTSRPTPKTQQKKVLRLTISDLAKGGDGVAHVLVNGVSRAVLVPRTAPGDVIDAQVLMGGALLRGELLSVISASDKRVSPACPHFADCGGCDLMHLSGQAQGEYRQSVVANALRKSLTAQVVVGFHEAPIKTGYRRRARVFIESTPKRTICGFREASSHRIVEVVRCLVLEPRVDEARARISSWIFGSTGRGEAIIQPGKEGRPTINLRWFGSLTPSVFGEAEQRVLSGEWAGVSIQLEGATKPAVIGDARGQGIGVDDLPFETSPGGFMQAFDAMNRKLVTMVVERAQCEGEKTLELFSGAGNISIGLARKTDFLETIENEASAVDAARANLSCRELSARLRVSDANQAKPSKDTRVVVLDPPRTGAFELCRAIAQSSVRRVVMVSCDPATLGRDIQVLSEGGFVLERVDALEMFPQTSHIECVALMSRSQSRGRKSPG